jgi:hypothetical protein
MRIKVPARLRIDKTFRIRVKEEYNTPTLAETKEGITAYGKIGVAYSLLGMANTGNVILALADMGIKKLSPPEEKEEKSPFISEADPLTVAVVIGYVKDNVCPPMKDGSPCLGSNCPIHEDCNGVVYSSQRKMSEEKCRFPGQYLLCIDCPVDAECTRGEEVK